VPGCLNGRAFAQEVAKGWQRPPWGQTALGTGHDSQSAWTRTRSALGILDLSGMVVSGEAVGDAGGGVGAGVVIRVEPVQPVLDLVMLT
jgi:hypothetical protein